MFVRTVCTCLAITAFCIIGANVHAAPPPTEAPQESLLKVGDKINVSVEGENDLSGFYTIDKAGMITMPLIGNILIAGKTAHEAKTLITRKLQDGYLLKPDVMVKGKPDKKTAPKAATAAQDTATPKKKPASKHKEQIHPCDRPLPPPPHMPRICESQKMHLPCDHKRHAGKHAKRVYIVGEIENPGYYPLPPKAGHILNIVALAGGYSQKADTRNFEVVRNIDGVYYRKQAQTGALEYHDGDIIIIGKR